mgnify:CR=1 FL=1
MWAEAKPDGTAPNNWLSIFGGPAWEWDTTRQQYYLHNFLAAQPDLNFHNAEVQEAVLGVARHWLERGVDGFRLDTVNFYFHDPALTDNPVLAPEKRNANTAPSENPYNWQDHLNDKTQPENLAFLKRLRALLDEFGGEGRMRATLGEVGESQRGREVMADYTAGSDKLHMCYDFDFLAPDVPDAGRVKAVIAGVQAAGGAGGGSWPCWAFSNHDTVRHPSRWKLDEPAQIRLMAALLLSLRGSVCLYQGEELGLGEAHLAYEDIRDPYGLRLWPQFKGRDGCRTPMPWAHDAPNAGFSDARPWLPLAPEHVAHAVDLQEGDPASILHAYRRLLTALCDQGYEVSLETGGAMDIAEVDPRVSVVMDLKAPGSGEQHNNRLENIPLLRPHHQVKFVLADRKDYDWARFMLDQHQLHQRVGDVLFSPVQGQLAPGELADWIVADRLPVRFQLQLHKLLWNDARGR